MLSLLQTQGQASEAEWGWPRGCGGLWGCEHRLEDHTAKCTENEATPKSARLPWASAKIGRAHV